MITNTDFGIIRTPPPTPRHHYQMTMVIYSHTKKEENPQTGLTNSPQVVSITENIVKHSGPENTERVGKHVYLRK